MPRSSFLGLACFRGGELLERFYANATRSMLSTRIHGWVLDKEVAQQFNQIKEFEELLDESGTTIFKLFLHISKEEQKRRLACALRGGSSRDTIPSLFSMGYVM
jgi:hypothetical protein